MEADKNKLDDLMDVLSNHIIDLILENPKKYLLKNKKKGGKLKESCPTKNIMQ